VFAGDIPTAVDNPAASNTPTTSNTPAIAISSQSDDGAVGCDGLVIPLIKSRF